ncbi:MAG: DUF2277 domain-containing protein [Chloroflexota bacterium]
MCRNIKSLFNFEPPATEEEIRMAALQFVRKVSGSRKPSKANEEPFQVAINEIAAATEKLLQTLVTSKAPKNREEEQAKARAKNAARFNR